MLYTTIYFLEREKVVLKQEVLDEMCLYSLLEEEDMRRWAGAGVEVVGGGGGGGGSSDGRGGGGGGVCMGGGGGGGGRGRSSVFPVPFSGAGAVSDASSKSAEPCQGNR